MPTEQETWQELGQFVRDLASRTSSSEILDRILQSIVRLTGAERGCIARVRGKDPVPGAVWPPADKGEDILIDASRTAIDFVLQTAQIVNSGNPLRDPRLTPSRSIHDLGVRSILCLPLNYREDILGALYLHHTERNDAFANLSMPLLETYAALAALAVAGSDLRHQSILDTTTGLYSHRFFQTTLEREVVLRERDQKPLSLLLIEVDHFPEIVKQHEPEAIRALLREIGGILTTLVRGTDVVVHPGRAYWEGETSRYEGHEFEVLLSEAARAGAVRVATRLQAVTTAKPFEFGRIPIPVTLSVGIACYPEDAKGAIELVRRANEALRAASRLGGGRLYTFE